LVATKLPLSVHALAKLSFAGCAGAVNAAPEQRRAMDTKREKTFMPVMGSVTNLLRYNAATQGL
jgi:hypothetical protein